VARVDHDPTFLGGSVRNLHWYLALTVIVGGLVSVAEGLVVLGNVLIVAGCTIWCIGYVLHTRRLQASLTGRPGAPDPHGEPADAGRQIL
jgi:hypothetical protein